MTAINVFVHPGAVHMMTDGVVYNHHNRQVIGTGAKVWPVPHLNAVIAVSGVALIGPLLLHAIMCQARSYDHLKASMGAFIEQVEEQVLPILEKPKETRVIVAGISETAGPNCYVATNYPLDSRHYPDFEVLPGAWVLFDAGDIVATPSHPKLNEAFRAACPHVDTGADCDPVCDGLKLMQLQRQLCADEAKIGGFAQLTIVTPDVITTRVIHRWDKDAEIAYAHAA